MIEKEIVAKKEACNYILALRCLKFSPFHAHRVNFPFLCTLKSETLRENIQFIEMQILLRKFDNSMQERACEGKFYH